MRMTGLRCEYLERCAGQFLRSKVLASGGSGGGGGGGGGGGEQQEETQTTKEADASLANGFVVLIHKNRKATFPLNPF
jgi:hypothetical protein